jgi:apolipoprotein D and lipocalin family protein
MGAGRRVRVALGCAMGLGAGLLGGCHARSPGPALPVVPRVDLARYLGTWHEIARYPNRFQEGCYASTATYTLRDDGRIDVLNQCREGGPDGSVRSAKGIAKIVDGETNAKLRVSFFRPFYGDYWIIDLGPEYEYAAVGHPSRRYLWILSRTPTMEESTYREILGRLADLGYEPQRLLRESGPPG